LTGSDHPGPLVPDAGARGQPGASLRPERVGVMTVPSPRRAGGSARSPAAAPGDRSWGARAIAAPLVWRQHRPAAPGPAAPAPRSVDDAADRSGGARGRRRRQERRCSSIGPTARAAPRATRDDRKLTTGGVLRRWCPFRSPGPPAGRDVALGRTRSWAAGPGMTESS
jgi:hypothetical protein